MIRITFFLFGLFWGGMQFSYAQMTIDTLQTEEIMDLSDEISLHHDSITPISHPGDSIYKYWDTQKIRYKDSTEVIFDSIPILLQDTFHQRHYIHPIQGPITSHFGYRRYRFHYGTDIDLITGDSVYAAFDGMVRVTTYNKGFGKVIVLRHTNGLETVYGHLSVIKVDSNQRVKAGDLIGLGGNTGRSTGSHLHYEIRYLGKAIDAESIIDFKTGKPILDTIYLSPIHFEYLKRIAADKNTKVYYVRKGDTLSGIAKRYRTSVNKLCYYNGIKASSVLQIGQKIRIR